MYDACNRVSSDDDMVDDADDNEDDYNDDDFEIYCIIIQITQHRMKSHIYKWFIWKIETWNK